MVVLRPARVMRPTQLSALAFTLAEQSMLTESICAACGAGSDCFAEWEKRSKIVNIVRSISCAVEKVTRGALKTK